MHVGELGQAESSASGASMFGRPARELSPCGGGGAIFKAGTWCFVYVPELVLSTFESTETKSLQLPGDVLCENNLFGFVHFRLVSKGYKN